MGLLADIYSAGDGMKRKVKGLLADPLGTIEQKINQFGEDQQAAINNAQDATGFGGNRSVLMSAQQKQQARQAMGDYASSMGLAGTVASKFAYPQDKALATAQKNAALPVAKGGLGLRPDNTPLERAQAMGFVDDAFHGTNADIHSFNIDGAGKTSGSGAFFTENPHVASTYSGREGGNVIPAMLRSESPVQVATNGANWNWIGKSAKVDAPKINVADKEGDSLMAELFGDSTPITVQKKAFKKTIGKLFPDDFKYDDHISTDDLARWANKEGYGSIVFDSVKDRGPNGIFANAESALPSKNSAVFNAANIRSRFAAFDPMRRNEADILGRADPELLKLMAGAGLLGAGGYSAFNDK